jgi:hypothetical protein
MEPLLTRDKFREGVFARDGHMCVVCKAPAQDAHHIIERRLWPDGGYYMSNGASVCGPCHIQCEQTKFSVEYIRQCAGITKFVLPPDLYYDTQYDKWGNPVLESGQRSVGPLFYDASVQKILSDVICEGVFNKYTKYPRTFHLPWSGNMNDDDRMVDKVNHLIGQEVVVTEKMDGENTTMYPDYIHARSIDGRNHPSRAWVKNFWGQICGDIPEGYRICGENLYAKHSIGYDDLSTYFMGFSMWHNDVCLSWDETLEWFELLGITPVPVLYRGPFSEEAVKASWKKSRDLSEGYVVRIADAFKLKDFKQSINKYVRTNHIQTVKHWMHGQQIIPNQLKKETKSED